ncbi:hypothetical protein WJX74_001277 [Apatococcus lobatus]|uniref:Uncharacterized protein n=2 Tax=Apatococcus TaxID=904362 RepID=A0AAW1SKB4_9CHLO
MRRSIVPGLKPQGPGCNDKSLRERVVNVVTALPFLALSRSELSQDTSQERKMYGLSMLAVGMAATAYHCSSGPVRKAFRRADYWSISLASNQLARAAHPGKMPLSLTALSLAATPFQPTAVTTVNMAAAEIGLARKAKQQPGVRKAYRHHVLAGATGLACFGLEDIAIQHDFHFVHSMWHCLAFYGLAKASSVLS